MIGVFRFEEIDDDLPLLPLAARRALDCAGVKVGLRAWQHLSIDTRRKLVALGTADEVDAEMVRAVVGSTPVEPRAADDETRLARPAPELAAILAATLGAESIDATEWSLLGRLERYALLHLAARNRPARLHEAYSEITRRGVVAVRSAGLTHLSPAGDARMVDVGAKSVSHRRAVAEARLRMRRGTAQSLIDASGPKGDALATARIAAISAAKRTSELIPLCHQVALSQVTVGFDVDVERGVVTIKTAADAHDRTGVEMEALVAASVAALTIYDMLKAVERGITIESLTLIEKLGGRSGHYRRNPSARDEEQEA
jgi:cyclic pyranopterin phosphate synthase